MKTSRSHKLFGPLTRHALLLCLLAICGPWLSASLSPSASFDWLRQWGGPETDGTWTVTADAGGRLYAAGFYEGTVDFGGHALPGVGTERQGFVLRLTPSGGVQWARAVAGSGVQILNLAVHPDGGVVGAGQFSSSSVSLAGSSISGGDQGKPKALLFRLSPSGDLIWSRVATASGAGGSFGGGIGVDAGGNVYVTINHFEALTLQENVSSAGNGEGKEATTLVKYTADGAYSWHRGVRGNTAGSWTLSYSLAVSQTGQVFMPGIFTGACLAEGTAAQATSVGMEDWFIASYDPDGSTRWFRTWGSTGNDRLQGATVGRDGDLYVTGFFSNTLSAGGQSVQSLGGTDAVLARVKANNGDLSVLARMAGTGANAGRRLVKDGRGGLLWSGVFAGTAHARQGVNLTNLATLSGGGMSGFVARWTEAGNHLWTLGTQGGTHEAGTVATNGEGSIYWAGAISGQVSFGTSVLTSVNNSLDGVLASLTETSAPPVVNNVPASVNAGSVATVNGSGFSAVTVVQVGGLAVDFEIVSDTQIRLFVGESTPSGTVTVFSPTGSAASGTPLTVVQIPVIVQHPQSVLAVGDVTLTVVATPAVPVSYQWEERIGTTFQNMAGQTSSSLAVTPTGTSRTFRVRALNSAGETTSNNATVRAPSFVDVAYGNGVFAAVGAPSGEGYVFTSDDGQNWTLRFAASGSSRQIVSIGYGNGRFVASRADGMAVVSTDGVDWSVQELTSNLDFPVYLNAVTFGQGKFVGVGATGIMISSDGVVWQTISLPAVYSFYSLESIVYGDGRFVASGTGGVVAVSTDGLDWTLSRTPSNVSVVEVAFNEGRFIAAAIGGVFSSQEGLVWEDVTPLKLLTGALYTTGNRVISGGRAYSVTTGGIMGPVSAEGLTHTTGTATMGGLTFQFLGQVRLRDVTAAGSGFAAIGSIDGVNEPLVFVSDNGAVWRSQPQYFNLPTPLWRAIAASADRVVAVGASGTTRMQKLGLPTPDSLHGLAYGFDRFVAVGTGGGIVTSLDGDALEVEVSPTTSRLNAVAYGIGLFVAVGEGGVVVNSPASGQDWRVRASGTTSHLHAVAYGNGKFVAVGAAGATTVSSNGGQSWTAGSVGGSNWLYGVTYGQGYYVAVGVSGLDERIFRSPDGVNWHLVHAGSARQLTGVAYGNGKFLAVGSGGSVLASTDGILWNSVAAPTSTWLRAVTWDGSRFVAVGDGGIALESADGLVWRNGASSAQGDLLAVAGSGSSFRAVTGGVLAALYLEPRFLTQPIGGDVAIGVPYVLSATTDTPGANYRWYKDGIFLGGSISSSYPFSPVSPDAEGAYFVRAHHPVVSALFSQSETVVVRPIVNFSDPVLEAAVRAAVGVASGGISAAQARGVERLDLSGAGIRRLDGIEYMRGLVELHLDRNEVADIRPLSELTGLRFLSLREIDLADLEALRPLRFLETLLLDRNRVVDLDPLTGMSHLRMLSLAENRVVDLWPLSSLPRLHTLNLRSNHLVRIDGLGGVVSLRHLDLRSNYISFSRSSLAHQIVQDLEATGATVLRDLQRLPFLEIVQHPVDKIGLEGQNSFLEVVANGDPAPSFQWFRNGIALTDTVGGAIEGTRSSRLQFNEVVPAMEGVYHVEVSNSQRTLISQSVAFSVIRLPVIVQQPADALVLPGGSATLQVAVEGTPPFTFRWYRMLGDTRVQVGVGSAQFTTPGLFVDTVYEVTISNTAGFVTSRATTVRVVVEFADANLEAAVREALGIAAGPVPYTLAKELKFLDASRRGITSLAGLENLTSLETLYLNDNRIADLAPLGALVKLRSLLLHNNLLEDPALTPLTGLGSLRALWLNGNDLKVPAALAQITSLEILRLRGNALTDFSFLSHLSGLQVLDLARTGVTSQSLSLLAGFSTLLELHLGENNLANVSALSGLTSLRWLFLPGNAIIEVTPLSSLVGLQELDLDFNQIGSIAPLSALVQLTDLWLNGNLISDLSPLQNLSKLEGLGIADNLIDSLQWIAGLTNLVHLEADGNDIASLAPLAALGQLRSLYLDDNLVTDVTTLQNLGLLRTLSLARNNIADVTPLASLIHLRTLNLDDTGLENILPLGALSSIRSLSLRDNDISFIGSLMGLADLRTLLLDRNLLVLGPGTQATQIIDSLRARGVAVSVNGQRVTMTVTLSHLQGAPGDWIALYGQGFAPDMEVYFGLAEAEVLFKSFTEILVKVPAGAATGPLVVLNALNRIETPQVFTVTAVNTVVFAWGDPGAWLNVPGDLTDATAVAGGMSFSIALRRNGSVRVWGNGEVTTVPSDLTDVIAVAAGANHALALRRDGRVVAWGGNSHGQAVVPSIATTGVIAIAAGQTHSLALKRDGSVVAWGSQNTSGTFIAASVLVPNAARVGVVAIATNSDKNLALKHDGRVIEWGRTDDSVPVGLTNAVGIAAGGSHSLAMRVDGTVVGWGNSAHGRTTPPAEAAGGVVAIAAGNSHSLALLEGGGVLAWGRNDSGETSVPPLASSHMIGLGNSRGFFSLAIRAPSKGPRFTGALSHFVQAGDAVAIDVETVDAAAVELLHLPSGVTFDPASRRILGSISAAGHHSFLALAHNAAGQQQRVLSIRVPGIIDFSPAVAHPGSTVKVRGVGLGGTLSVKIDGWPAAFQILSDNEIDVIVPEGAESAPVEITTLGRVFVSQQILSIPSALILHESFDYPAGSILQTTGNWDFLFGGTDPLLVTDSSLSYAPLRPGMGGSLSMTPSGFNHRAVRHFPSVTMANGDEIWASFLVRVDDLGVLSGSDLFAFGQSSSNHSLVRLSNLGSSPGHFRFSIFRATGSAGGYTHTTEVAQGVSHFVVVRYRRENGLSQDLRIWVNPTPESFGAGEFPAAAQLTAVNSQGGTVTTFQSAILFGAVGANAVLMDDVRIGRTWRSVAPAAPPPPSGFAAWFASHGLPGGDPDPLASPAGDGVPNLLKYALGLDPMTPSAHLLPEAGTAMEMVAGQMQPVLALAVAWNPDATGIRFILEGADSPAGPWSAVRTVVPGPGTPTPLILNDNVSISGNAVRFIRLRVEML